MLPIIVCFVAILLGWTIAWLCCTGKLDRERYTRSKETAGFWCEQRAFQDENTKLLAECLRQIDTENALRIDLLRLREREVWYGRKYWHVGRSRRAYSFEAALAKAREPVHATVTTTATEGAPITYSNVPPGTKLVMGRPTAAYGAGSVV